DSAYNTMPLNRAEGRPGDSPAPAADETTIDWVMVYDENNLYVFFDIKDSALSLDSPGQGWNDDSLEFVIDGNNSDVNTYGQTPGIVKLTFIPQQDGSLVISTTDSYPPPPNGTDFSGVEAAYRSTATGWSVEAKIPLSVYGMTATPGA